ncbi:MAG: MAPEG family protein [Caulobacteraceae bacterium]
MTPAGHAASLWAGLHLFLLLILSMLVVRQRQKHHVAFGDEGIPELAQAIRAQANAAEYIPAGIAAIAALAVAGAPPLVIHLGGVALFLGRVIHAVALSRSTGSSMARSIGMLATWVAYIFIGSCLLVFAMF